MLYILHTYTIFLHTSDDYLKNVKIEINVDTKILLF